MKERWSESKAQEWYDKLPWLRGCNFIGSDCANRFDMWQSYKAEEKLATAKRELALCEDIGFNTVRIWIIFESWLNEPQFFMQMLEEYISICAEHHLAVMLCLTSEEDLPCGEYSDFRPIRVGEQKYAVGYHQGQFPESAERAALPKWHYAQSTELAPKFWQMIKDIVNKYATDERILCWNIYNEPGITLKEDECIPVLTKMFETVRACDPIQPVTADVWRGLNEDDSPKTKVEEIALKNSDIISFHNYSSYCKFCKLVDAFSIYNRPIFCTEWLHRINHNIVGEIYPLLYIKNIANYCWGFVVGKTQTNEPWDILWNEYYDPNKNVDYDFTKWQHDLFRPNFRPYDPTEIDLIKQFNKLADKRFSERKR